MLRPWPPRRRQRFGSLGQILALVLESVGNRKQNAAKSRAVHLIFRRIIGAAIERLTIGHQETGQRPATLPANRADRGLIARVDVGPLVAIHFDRHEMFIDELGDFRILVALAVNHMAPVAPHRADIEQDGFVVARGFCECVGAPLVPIDGLMRRGTQDTGWRSPSIVVSHFSATPIPIRW